MEPEGSSPHSKAAITCRYSEPDKSMYQMIIPSPRPCEMFRNIYGEELLTPCPASKDHPLSAVHDCLCNIFAASVHTGGRSSIRNMRTRRVMVTGTHLSLIVTVLLYSLVWYGGSYTMGTGSYPGVKRPGHDADHPPPSKCRGQERVGLYLYSPSGPSWPYGSTFTLQIL